MTNERRQLLLKIGAAAAAGLFVFNLFVIEPAMASWTQQSERIAKLREKVQRGQQLRERAASINARWNGMLRANLPAEVSAAESAALKAVNHWVRQSEIKITSLAPSWQNRDRDEGVETYEYRMTATGSQAALGRFIQELETDQTIPVNLEECELATRDPRGAELTLTARITFLRIKETKKATP